MRNTVVLAVMLFAQACANTPEPRELTPHTVEMRGELVASRSVTLSAPFDGTVKRLVVREGDVVHEGDELLELTNPELDHNVAIARAQRELAERRMIASPDDVAITEAAAIAKRKKGKRDRYRALYATHDVTLQEVEEAENEYSAALRDLAAMRASNSGNPRIAAIEAERARAEEKLSEERMRSMTLRAPIEGTVTRLEAMEGREASARAPLVEVTSMSALEARADVDPDLLRVIRPGMSVEARIMTVPPRVMLDKVAYVVPFRQGQQGERHATVVVNIPNPDHSLQPGTPVVLTVKTQ